jgi:hypothetical protein
MRRIVSLCTFLSTIFISGVVLGQVNGEATIESGYASTWVFAPGAYATPWTPLLSTPSAAFASPQLQVGASNATYGNVAGASNMASMSTTGAQGPAQARGTRVRLGIATSQDDYGLATLTGIHHVKSSANKVYTNEDVERVKSSGTNAQGK